MAFGIFESSDQLIPAIDGTGTGGANAIQVRSKKGADGIASIAMLAFGDEATAISASSNAGVAIHTKSPAFGLFAEGGNLPPGGGVPGDANGGVYASGESYGVYAHSPDGTGIQGVSNTATGIWGAGGTIGVFAQSDNVGVQTHNNQHGNDVFLSTPTNAGLFEGPVYVDGGQTATGLYAQSTNVGAEFHNTIQPPAGSGIVNEVYLSEPDKAAFFNGDIHVVGDIIKYGHNKFKIDHPLDPTRRYLSHVVVESPDMKNIYDGVVVLDANGEAEVTLSDWFEALNTDFRYQLTCIGGYAPVYITQEIQGNRFGIAGGVPGLKVSWQVTGIRQDTWAKAHPMKVEEDKSVEEQGHYLHPELHGEPEEKSIAQILHPHAQPTPPERPPMPKLP